MLRKILLTAGILVIWMASPASAQYGTGTIQASQSTVVEGAFVTISGDGCQAGEQVDLSLQAAGQTGGATPAGSTTADANGGFSLNVSIPTGSAPGYTITSQCGTLTLATFVSVAPAGT